MICIRTSVLGLTVAAAVLGGPADARPSRLPEVALPGEAFLDERAVVTRAAPPPHDRELAGEVLCQPGSDLASERLVLCVEVEVHAGEDQCDPKPCDLVERTQF